MGEGACLARRRAVALEVDMSWTHSFITRSDDGSTDRLRNARLAFIDAHRALEAAREDLLQAHASAIRPARTGDA